VSELAKIQVLQGPDLQREVARSKVYRYTLNSAALWILAGFAGICVVLGALSYFFASSPWSLVGLGVFGGLGAIFGITITYWYHVGEKMVVATNKEALMVGDMDKMWSFRWELLDAESIGLKDMAVTRASGRLMIKAGGQTVPLLLYSPFAHIDDAQGFMATVLEKVQAP
jgi:fucose 4-O-acetylase-like acetyltransferase